MQQSNVMSPLPMQQNMSRRAAFVQSAAPTLDSPLEELLAQAFAAWAQEQVRVLRGAPQPPGPLSAPGTGRARAQRQAHGNAGCTAGAAAAADTCAACAASPSSPR